MDALGVCVETSVLGARVQAQQAAAQAGAAGLQTIPRTGTRTRTSLILAGILLLVGTPLALVGRRHPGKHYADS
jgi:LPXTG-motif cell wall-anchored protein